MTDYERIEREIAEACEWAKALPDSTSGERLAEFGESLRLLLDVARAADMQFNRSGNLCPDLQKALTALKEHCKEAGPA